MTKNIELTYLIRYISRNAHVWGLFFTISFGIITFILSFEFARYYIVNNIYFIVLAFAGIALSLFSWLKLTKIIKFLNKKNWILSVHKTQKATNELTDIRIISVFTERLINNYGLRFYDFEPNSNTSISDISLYFKRFLYINKWPEKALNDAIEEARAVSYDIKYGEDRENDEKILFRNLHGAWENYLINYCDSNSIRLFGKDSVLEVGFGTGLIYEGGDLFDRIYGSRHGKKYITDISQVALKRAKSRFKAPGRIFLVSPAENLHRRIPPSAIDIYLSFRTYSSSLFDRKRALIEAKRVLKPGGTILITVPHMLPRSGGTYETGLMRDVKDKKPTKKYRDEVVRAIRDDLNMLGFFDVKFDASYPYEVFISGRKGDIS